MTTALAVAGWLGLASLAWLSVARTRIAESMMDKLGETVQRLYEDNCTLRDTVAEKDAEIIRQMRIVWEKDEEMDRIGVRRNAKGQLESLR